MPTGRGSAKTAIQKRKDREKKINNSSELEDDSWGNLDK